MLHVHLILVQLSLDIGIAVHLDLFTRNQFGYYCKLCMLWEE